MYFTSIKLACFSILPKKQDARKTVKHFFELENTYYVFLCVDPFESALNIDLINNNE